MNKLGIWGIAIATVFVTSILTISAFEAQAIKPEPLAAAVCPAENVQHWETIAWGSSVAFQHPTLPSISGGISKAQVDPNVAAFSYNGLIAEKLNNLGYTKSGSPITAGDIPIALKQEEPQIICAEN